MQAAIIQFAEINASTTVQTAAQIQPVEPTPEGASTPIGNPEIVNDDSSIPDDELSIFPGEILKKIFEFNPLSQLLGSWTCTEMYKTCHVPKPSAKLIAESAAASNLFAYNILVSAKWVSALPPNYPHIVGGFCSNCPADFFALSTPIDELIEICSRKEVSYKALRFLIWSDRPDALEAAKRLIDVAPSVMIDTHHRELLTCAVNARSRPFIDLITSYRTFSVKIEAPEPGSICPSSDQYTFVIHPYMIGPCVVNDDAPVLEWFLENGIELGNWSYKIANLRPPAIIELLRRLGHDID